MDDKSKHYYDDLGEQLACYITKDTSLWSMYQRNYFPPKDLPAAGVGKNDWSFVYEEDDCPYYEDNASVIRIDRGNYDNIKKIINMFQQGLVKESHAEHPSIEVKETAGDEGPFPLYIIVKPLEAVPLWSVVNPDYRGWAVPDLKACLEDFVFDFFDKNVNEIKNLNNEDRVAFIRDGVKKEFPKLSKENVEYVIRQVEDYLSEEDDYEDPKEKLDDFLYDNDWSNLPKKTTTKDIKDIILKEFPDISAADLKYAVDFVKETLDDLYYNENYIKGENRMYNTLEEAFKELNRKPRKPLREAKEEKKVCPDCGKEVCECNKVVNEDIEITSDEIKDFIAKVGADAIKKALDDFEGVAAVDGEEFDDSELAMSDEDVAKVNEPFEGEESPEEAEENADEEAAEENEEEVKEALAEDLRSDYQQAYEKWKAACDEVAEYKIPVVQGQPDFEAVAEKDREAAKKAHEKYEQATKELKVAQNRYFANESLDEGILDAASSVVNGVVDGIKSIVDSKEPEEGKEEIEEAIQDLDLTGVPITFIPENEIKAFADNYAANLPAPGRPPRFFKLGYARQMSREVAAQFRSDRSERTANKFPEAPIVNIIKCTEYSAVYSGSPWLGTNATRNADKVLGAERHTGERTGFGYGNEDNIVNLIGAYPDGSKALQIYIADHSRQRVKYFISVNGEQFRLADKEEVANYLTPGEASKVLNGREAKPAGFNAEGNAVFDKPINRVKLSGVYMLGNLGHSIF